MKANNNYFLLDFLQIVCDAFKVLQIGLCDLGKISYCDFFDRYYDCDLICDFNFAK